MNEWTTILRNPGGGVVIARRDFKKRTQVDVFHQCDGEKHVIRTYRFPCVSQKFNSRYISWANLNCCGGWRFDESYLDTAVQEGKKLYAGRSTYLRSQYFPNAPTKDEAIANLSSVKSVLPPDIKIGLEYDPERDRKANYLNSYICRSGRLVDYYDLEEVFDFYRLMETELTDAEKEEVRKYCQKPIEGFGRVGQPYRYCRAETVAQLVTTGLLLGYPLETTASIIAGY